MSASTKSSHHDGHIFVCECDERFRSACRSEIFYKEKDGKRYCVLHYPDKDKSKHFKEALERKLAAKNFNFRGVWFPDLVDFRNFEFTDFADFRAAIFNAHSYFSSAKFNKDVYFSSVIFDSVVNFSRAIFQEKSFANFSNTRFKDKVVFSNNVFATLFPLRFDDANIEKPERVTFHTVSLRPHWFVNVDTRKFNFVSVGWAFWINAMLCNKSLTL